MIQSTDVNVNKDVLSAVFCWLCEWSESH